MPSDKTTVIEHLFWKYWDEASQSLSKTVMSLDDVAVAIDGLFLGVMATENGSEQVIVTCEAKHYKDPFIPQQIINQVQAAFGSTDVSTVIPIGMKAIKNVGFYVTEFQAVRRENSDALVELTRASHGIYELHPPVRGI